MSTLGTEDVDVCSATGQAAASHVQQGSNKAKHHKGRRQMDDTFMMTMYKVKLCTRTTAHNWKLCPWAHPGETVIRRHPSSHMAEMCPAVRQHQDCPHGDGCIYSRNTFECWLHPSRYRTTMCSSGEGCTRNICFFAHNEQELRSPPSPDSAQPWALVASAPPQPGQPQVLQDADLELSQQQLQGISNTAGVVAPLAASSGMMVSPLAARCGSAGDVLGAVGPVALSPGSSHSCPLPNSCLVVPGGAWHLTPATCTPAVTTAPSAQQAQLQALLQHQMQPMLQQQGYVGPANGAVLAGRVSGAGYASTTHAGQGAVLGPTASQPPILSACGSAGVLCSMGQPQSMHLLGEGKQYSPVGSGYNISATAGMFAAGVLVPGAGGLVAAAVTAPLDASVCMQGLQTNSCDSLAASDCDWQHQQLAMLLQRMQLSGGTMAGGALHFSSDSLSSSVLLGGSNPLPSMSRSLLSDLSTESLASLLAGHPLTQELPVNSAAHLSGMTTQDLQLLPLEASGLIQLSALDETAVVADQLEHKRKQAVTLAMQQAGGRW